MKALATCAAYFGSLEEKLTVSTLLAVVSTLSFSSRLAPTQSSMLPMPPVSLSNAARTSGFCASLRSRDTCAATRPLWIRSTWVCM